MRMWIPLWRATCKTEPMAEDTLNENSELRWPNPFSILGDPKTAQGGFVFTCEHASNAVGSLAIDSADEQILATHWGWDIGAADEATEH